MANEKRLIDANALPSGWMLAKFTEINGKMCLTRTMPLSACPIEDAVEVVHGRWIDTEMGTLCSNCHRCFDPDFEIKRSVCRELKHCPNCGAKMDGDGNG